MNHVTAGEYWNSNAEAWTKLARAGYDVYRDHLNTPAFLAMLPPVAGLRGIDIGCGEGHNTRLLAQRGATMTAIDIAPAFIRLAQAEETRAPIGITYREASAVALPFGDRAFAFATAFMSLHDIPETEPALAEAFRVLEPGGFLQFSILHPCFNPPHRRNCRDEDDNVHAVEVGDYFVDARGHVDEWIFGAAPASSRTAAITRSGSSWARSRLLSQRVTQSTRIARKRPSLAISVSVRRSGSSMVVHSGPRRSRCLIIRSSISASRDSLVAK